jgi:hypothetical protein
LLLLLLLVGFWVLKHHMRSYKRCRHSRQPIGRYIRQPLCQLGMHFSSLLLT